MLLPHLCEWRPWHFISNQDFTPAPRLAKKHRTWDLLIVIVELPRGQLQCLFTAAQAPQRFVGIAGISHWQLLLA